MRYVALLYLVMHNFKNEVKGQSSPSFELVDVLIASAQNIVHMICERITCRISGSRKRVVNPNL